jgi:hypothetical protein
VSTNTRRLQHWRFSAGILLRLVYETFRIVPTVAEVEAIGTRPHGGEEAVMMRLKVTRARFAAADLGEPNFMRPFHSLGGDARVTDEFEMAPITATPQGELPTREE